MRAAFFALACLLCSASHVGFAYGKPRRSQSMPSTAALTESLQTLSGEPAGASGSFSALARMLLALDAKAGWQAPGWLPRGARAAAAGVDGLSPRRFSRQAGTVMELRTDDPRIFTVELERPTGIDFGCDGSLRWPYILSLDPRSAAARTGLLSIYDQLISIEGNSVVGLPMATCMEAMGAIPGATVELTFFRGSADELQRELGIEKEPEVVAVTVRQVGKPDMVLKVPYGANLRDQLISRGINVYQSVTRWTNCNGQQLCGTCIVNIIQGFDDVSKQGLDERQLLIDSPQTYKLSCQTEVYGNITVQVFPKIGAGIIVRR
mmetsp:Transcript_151838/g.268101  ORF Transcript_151838/g.268101 Transcript_151838/m.268101 type:complete len:321 (-) Transcript_151838:223-1185(-)